MKNQKEQIRKAMKLIGKVTLETLPDILNSYGSRSANIDWRCW